MMMGGNGVLAVATLGIASKNIPKNSNSVLKTAPATPCNKK